MSKPIGSWILSAYGGKLKQSEENKMATLAPERVRDTGAFLSLAIGETLTGILVSKEVMPGKFERSGLKVTVRDLMDMTESSATFWHASAVNVLGQVPTGDAIALTYVGLKGKRNEYTLQRIAGSKLKNVKPADILEALKK